MPEVATVRHVGVQNEKPYLWALVNPKSPEYNRVIITKGTGHPIKAFSGKYVGTYQLKNGALVFHVFIT